MARGRWRKSEESLGKECFSVLIEKEKPSRAVTRAVLLDSLSHQNVRSDFLKLCLEYDDSKDLKRFKQGLLLVVKALGATQIARATKLDRVNLYRMLTPSGNPSFASITTLCRVLGVRIWVVDEDFILRRERHIRPKDQIKEPPPLREDGDKTPGSRRINPKRYNRDWTPVSG